MVTAEVEVEAELTPGPPETLAGRVRHYRSLRQISQQELATLAKLSVSIVAQIERGKARDPKVSTVRAIAGALGVRTIDLLGEG